LAEEAPPGVDVRAFADGGHEESALQWRAARIVRLEERRVRAVPVVREVESPLLHPALPVLRDDFVGHMEDATGGVERRHRRGFGRHAGVWAGGGGAVSRGA